MSVTSVVPDRPTPYRPISGNTPQRGKFATPLSPDRATPTDRQGTVAAGYADPTDVSQFESALAQALRADEATASGSTSTTSEPDGGQSSTAGIALYRRVSQIGNSEPSASELLRSWNSIMQSGQDPGDAGTATLQALLRTGTQAFGSSIIDVTA
jgi:hypothetical protein